MQGILSEFLNWDLTLKNGAKYFLFQNSITGYEKKTILKLGEEGNKCTANSTKYINSASSTLSSISVYLVQVKPSNIISLTLIKLKISLKKKIDQLTVSLLSNIQVNMYINTKMCLFYSYYCMIQFKFFRTTFNKLLMYKVSLVTTISSEV